jgi:hypothetical protein
MLIDLRLRMLMLISILAYRLLTIYTSLIIFAITSLLLFVLLKYINRIAY